MPAPFKRASTTTDARHFPRSPSQWASLLPRSGWVLHVRLTLLQIGQFLLDGGTGIASGQPGQVVEHPLGSLVFEPVQYSLQPGGGQSPSCCLHGLPDLIDVFGAMGKIQDAHGIRTVVVDQPRPPLRSILHGADLCRPFQPSPMRFDQ